MNFTKKYFLVFCMYVGITTLAIVNGGCSFMSDVSHAVGDLSHGIGDAFEKQADHNAGEKVNATENKKKKNKQEQTRTTKKEKSRGNTITAPGLSNSEIDELWSVVIDTCYDLGYSMTFNDRKTKNLACQTETQGGESTYTMRVRFSNKGILIDAKSNSMANFVFGGAATKHDTQKMKSSLETKLQEMRGENPSRSDRSHKTYNKGVIYKAQEQLSGLKYDPGLADGIMGEKTVNAIMSFQRDNNLVVSGEFDEATLKRLNKLSAK